MNFIEFGLNLLFCLGLFLLSVSITRLMIRINIEDKPNERSSHTKATPRSGGVAIVLSFSLGAILVSLLENKFTLPANQLFALLGGGFLMAFIAFMDDLKGMRQIVKFAGQFVSIGIIVASGLYFKKLSFLFVAPIELSPIMGIILTICWLLFFMNGFNFMDGLNGIASGTAMVASIFLCILGYWAQDYATYILSLILAFSILGFFIFNFPKGKIFLGDIGSQYMALILAMIGVIASQNEHYFISEMTIPFLFFIFVFDVLMTLIKRLMKRENIFQAHKSHLYQRLNQCGYSHAFVTNLHLLFVCIGGAAVLYLHDKGVVMGRFLFLVLLSIAVVYSLIVYNLYKKSAHGAEHF